MAGTAGVPLKDRKYLTVKDMSAHMGLGIIMIKNIIKGGKFKDYITVGKSKKVMIDCEAFEKWVVEQGHIQ